MTRYKNKKVVVDGHIFDSKMEAEYYRYLLEEQEKGNVKEFELQPVFELIPSFQSKGKTVRRTTYIADFLVTYRNGVREVIDVKGVKTTVFQLKKKLFAYKHPQYTLRMVRKVGSKWVDLT